MEIIGLYWVISNDKVLSKQEIFKINVNNKDVENITFSSNTKQSEINLLKQYSVKEFFKFLEESGIIYFYPYRKITLDFESPKSISFCYYQNFDIYQMATSELKNGYFMRPNIIIMSKLHDMYDSYLINCDEQGNIFL